MGRCDYETETMIAHALRGDGFDASEDGTGRGTPIVPEAYGLSTQQEPKWAENVSPTLAIPSKSGGGQVTAVAIQERAVSENLQNGPGGSGISTDGAAYTLEARNKVQAVQYGWRVRRLTPVECERLQGFPCGYTNIPYRNKSESPDGPRYKALGNSMAVNCMRWIGRRIEMAEQCSMRSAA